MTRARVHPEAPRGAVLVAALLALTLLASAVFFVFNVGTHLHRRIQAQHAADAAAIAGAGWVARTMNLVAMNNVESAALMAQVQVYDAIPLAVRNSLADAEAAVTGLDWHLEEGVRGRPWLREPLAFVQSELSDQAAKLEAVRNAIANPTPGSYDIAEMTHFDLDPDEEREVRGSLWEAAAALETISVTALEEMGVSAQLAAHHAARRNLGGTDDGEFGGPGGRGFMAPFIPVVPWERGEPSDFVKPLTEGRLPDDQDDPQWARGPFDVLFGLWRVGADGRTRVQQDFPVPLADEYPIVEARPERELATGPVVQYRTVPMFEFFARQLEVMEREALDGELSSEGRSSWFAERAVDSARQNQDYFAARLEGGDDVPPETLMANWSGDWAEKRRLENAPVRRPRQRDMWVYLEFAPEIVDANGDPVDGNVRLVGWGLYPYAPVGLINGSGIDNTSIIESEDRFADDRIRRMSRGPAPLPGGDPTEQYVQHTYFFWCAFDEFHARTGRAQAEPRNPNNFNDPDDLPAPVKLNTEQMPPPLAGEDPAQTALRERFTRFFAAADQPATAALWSGLFDGADAFPRPDDAPDPGPLRPNRRVTAVAEAEIFNNHSWDLWTQMWHAELVRVRSLGGWLDFMRPFDEGSKSDALESVEGFPPDFGEQVGEIFRYLETVQPLFDALDEPRRPGGSVIGSE